MRSPPLAMSVIWSTVAGRRSTAAWARPSLTAAKALSTPCWKVTSWGGRDSRARSSRLLSRSRTPSIASGRGRASQAPSDVTSASAGVRHPRREGVARGPGLEEVEVLAQGAGEVEPIRQAAEESVDGRDRQLLRRQLHDVGEGASCWPLSAALFPVLERGLVTVMAVSDDHGLGGHRAADRLDHARPLHPPEAVMDVVVVGPRGDGRFLGPAQLGEPGGRRQPPDRGQVRPAGAGISRRSLLALGVVFSWEDPVAGRSQLERTQHTRGLPGTSLLVAVSHAVDVKGRLVVLGEHAVGLPVVEKPGGHGVAILAVLVRGQIDANHVVGVPVGQPGPQVVVDDVVGER